MQQDNDIIVSVDMITYNHEKFIVQAIEGVLMQKTNFRFELVIGEDCSTDRTREICIEYRNKYPDIIKLLLPEKNLGVRENGLATIRACRGKYIALCEGDDYWTDPYKLQKQVDFLEANEEYVLSYTSGYRLKSNKLSPWIDVVMQEPVKEMFYNGTFIRTCTSIFRSSCLKTYLNMSSLLESEIIGDWPLFSYLSTQGKISFLEDRTSVYRFNPSSVSNRSSYDRYLRYSLDIINIKRFLRDYIFTKDLDEIYSEHNLKKDEAYVRLKHAFDIFDYKLAKANSSKDMMTDRSRFLSTFTGNIVLFYFGCIIKKTRERVSDILKINKPK